MPSNIRADSSKFEQVSNLSRGFQSDLHLQHSQETVTLPISSSVMKRTFDIVIGTSMLAFFFPLIILISLMLYIIYGTKVFYGQERIGKNGKIFRCLKFRTMILNAEDHLEELLKLDHDLRTEWETTHKLKNDPRIHQVGWFIRKLSLDELPQLINVIKGEMSLVGPRPVTTEELKKYKQFAPYYLTIRPGLTGIWQISGRNNIDYETRVNLDMNYIADWSLSKDLIIYFKTVLVFVLGRGAY